MEDSKIKQTIDLIGFNPHLDPAEQIHEAIGDIDETYIDLIGFNPHLDPAEQIHEAIGDIDETYSDPKKGGVADKIADAFAIVDNMDNLGVLLHWHRFDEEDEDTWPERYEKVLALRVWSKAGCVYGVGGDKSKQRTASFYQPAYGMYMRAHEMVNGEEHDEPDRVVFAHDQGEQNIEDDDDWCEPPLWWARIATPQQLELE